MWMNGLVCTEPRETSHARNWWSRFGASGAVSCGWKAPQAAPRLSPMREKEGANIGYNIGLTGWGGQPSSLSAKEDSS
jgi:hypothetical protein